MQLLDRTLKETTCQGKTLDIYIKKADSHNIEEWVKQGTHQYLIVFHFNNVPNPHYCFTYYIDTIAEGSYGGGLCLHGAKYEYASVSKEVMDRVQHFIQEFVTANNLNLAKEVVRV